MVYKIKEITKHELIVKNSRFIALIYPVESQDEVEILLKEAKLKYQKATHYTYAYKTLKAEKSSDDGEPSGTAGIPILNVLQKQDLMNILVIVIRYFGGIKLGAGGLVRAYTKACKEAIEKTTKVKLIPAKKIKIQTEYHKGKELDYLLENNNSNIIEKIFTDSITYIVILEKETILKGHFSYEIIGNDYIEKEL